MPFKNVKFEDDKKLSISRNFYAKSFTLSLRKDLCKGCDICSTICPKGAIRFRKNPKVGEKAKAVSIDFDEKKCDFHGICETLCPFGAIEIKINDQRTNPVIEKECFPRLIREIEIDDKHCKPNCKLCEEICPLGIIKVRFESLDKEEKNHKNKTIVEVKKELCPCCKKCESLCPVGVIKVRKFFTGKIGITVEKCPAGCHDCVDVCPVGALYLDNGAVHINDILCIYCKACLNICPQKDALNIVRTSVYHDQIGSGVWNKTLEKLTSTSSMNKELFSKGLSKAVNTIKKRV